MRRDITTRLAVAALIGLALWMAPRGFGFGDGLQGTSRPGLRPGGQQEEGNADAGSATDRLKRGDAVEDNDLVLQELRQQLPHLQAPWLTVGADETAGQYDDAKVLQSIEDMFRQSYAEGVRVFDTGAQYLHGNTELRLGAALKGIPRRSYVLYSKGGCAPAAHRNGVFRKASLVVKDWTQRYNFTLDDVHVVEPYRQRYSLHPEFLRASLESSMSNLNTDYVDSFLLHSLTKYPKSTPGFSPPQLLRDLQRAFVYLERERQRGRVGVYGFSSGNYEYRETCVYSQVGSKWHVQLEVLVNLARRAAEEVGLAPSRHGFRVVMALCDIAHTACLTEKTQTVRGKDVSVVQAVRMLALSLRSQTSLNHGKQPQSACAAAAATHLGWEDASGDETAMISAGLHASRSMVALTGGGAVTVRHLDPSHRKSNLAVMDASPMPAELLQRCLQRPLYYKVPL